MVDCWINSDLVLDELRSHFGDINRQVSTYYEDNPYVREEALDGHLATHIAAGLPERRITRLSDERVRSGRRPLSFQFAAREITHGEREHGADLGVVARIVVPNEMVLTKAALVQSKKLRHYNGKFRETSDYPELFGSATKNLRSQARRMLDITPDAFYFFYNPERLHIKRGIKSLGMRAMPARIIDGMEAAGRNRFSALEAFDSGEEFESWIVDRFICCGVGDMRSDVVDTALGANREFPVRHVIEIGITAGEVSLDLFARS